MTTTTDLDGIVAEHVEAVNALDDDAIVATFADDALVNDAHREFWGTDAIRRWVAKEIVGDKVTLEVTEVIDHYGETIVRGRYDGEFDKTDLPDELILTNYFTVRDGKIVSLIVIHNTPANLGTLAQTTDAYPRVLRTRRGPRDRLDRCPVHRRRHGYRRGRDSPRHRPNPRLADRSCVPIHSPPRFSAPTL